ncbi:hypothetical protein I6Y99_004190 [Vibrio parahaemolyticus]|nr:hypothetical protein [Vibrio parahaemolyticus]
MSDKLIKLMNNIEYCTTSRAARFLECEVEDIEHFLMVGAIGAYVSIHSNELFSSALFLFKDQDTSQPFQLLLNHFESLIVSEFSSLTIQEAHCINEGTYQLEANLDGVWGISSLVDVANILLTGNAPAEFTTAYRSEKRELYAPLDLDENPVEGFATGFNGDYHVKRDELLILKKDLLKLYDALHGDGGELMNMHNSDDLRQKLNKSNNDRPPKVSRSSDTAKLTAIGALSYLISQDNNRLSRSGKPNATQIANKIHDLLADFDNKVTSELYKDISRGCELFMSDIWKNTDDSK